MKIISGIRKNIGTIIASFGFLLLCIVTFGDLADIATEEYWRNVMDNLTSIGFMTVALTMIQVSIKQGVAEQALQRGLNTDNTTLKWTEHRDIIKRSQERIIYMPYFLQIYNERQTLLRKREFLINNNYNSEAALLNSGKKRLIYKYNSIRVYLTVSRIKWATTEIVYNKHGQIQTLAEYRSARLAKGIFLAFIFMIGVTFLTTGLFLSSNGVALWQKFVKLGSYILTISMSSIYAIVRGYEKGAFGVPNELDELNAIWAEFEKWKTPDWIIKEVDELNQPKEVLKNEQKDSKTQSGINAGTAIQKEPQKSEVAPLLHTNSAVLFPGALSSVSNTDPDKFSWERDEHSKLVGWGPRRSGQSTEL